MVGHPVENPETLRATSRRARSYFVAMTPATDSPTTGELPALRVA